MHQMDPTGKSEIWNWPCWILEWCSFHSDCINLLLSTCVHTKLLWTWMLRRANRDRYSPKKVPKIFQACRKTMRIVNKYRNMHDPTCRIIMYIWCASECGWRKGHLPGETGCGIAGVLLRFRSWGLHCPCGGDPVARATLPGRMRGLCSCEDGIQFHRIIIGQS